MKHAVVIGFVGVGVVGCAARAATWPRVSEAFVAAPRVCQFGEVAACQLACDRGEALSCNNLGAMYEVGKGVAIDRDRARELYRYACFAKAAPEACANLVRAAPEPVAATEPAPAPPTGECCRGQPGIHISGNVEIHGNVTIYGDVFLDGRPQGRP